MKFLIDECLSAELARDRGFVFSTHATWLGLQSKSDWSIVRGAVEESYVLVTNNTADFTALVGRESIHAGLVCLNAAPGLMKLQVQRNLFRLALDQLAGDEPIKDIVDITLNTDQKIKIDRYTWHANR